MVRMTVMMHQMKLVVTKFLSLYPIKMRLHLPLKMEKNLQNSAAITIIIFKVSHMRKLFFKLFSNDFLKPGLGKQDKFL